MWDTRNFKGGMRDGKRKARLGYALFRRDSYGNEDLRPLRKRRSITKTKTHYENEDPSRKQRHITKTSSKEVGITFVDKGCVHNTHYENEDSYGNLEF